MYLSSWKIKDGVESFFGTTRKHNDVIRCFWCACNQSPHGDNPIQYLTISGKKLQLFFFLNGCNSTLIHVRIVVWFKGYFWLNNNCSFIYQFEKELVWVWSFSTVRFFLIVCLIKLRFREMYDEWITELKTMTNRILLVRQHLYNALLERGTSLVLILSWCLYPTNQNAPCVYQFLGILPHYILRLIKAHQILHFLLKCRDTRRLESRDKACRFIYILGANWGPSCFPNKKVSYLHVLWWVGNIELIISYSHGSGRSISGTHLVS